MDTILPLAPFVLFPLLLTALCIPPIKRLAQALDLVDHPTSAAHKSHAQPTPYGGALAIALGLSIGLFLCVPLLIVELPSMLGSTDRVWALSAAWLAGEFLIQSVVLTSFLGCGMGLFCIGLIDDWRSLSPLTRFVGQLAFIVLLIYTQPLFRLDLLPGMPLLNALLSVVWIGAMSNAFNFLDNMDGLSAGIGAICLVFLGFAALLAGEPGVAVVCLMCFGACCGFLLYNLPPASIFMGDAGSLFLGYTISAIAAYLSQNYSEMQIQPALRWGPLLLIAIPVYDFVSVNFLRIKRGQAPWVGDKNHISHRLVRLGLSRRSAVLCIYLATALSGLPSLLSAQPTGQTLWLWCTPIGLCLLALADTYWYRPPESQ